MTATRKIQLIHDDHRTRAEFATLSRTAKEEVLEGMEIATDAEWILVLIADAREKYAEVVSV